MAERVSQFAQRQVEFYKRALEAAEGLELRLRNQSQNIHSEKKRDAEAVARLEEIRRLNEDGDVPSTGYNIHQLQGNHAFGNTKHGRLFIKRQGVLRSGFKKKQAVIREDGFLYIYQNHTEEYKINLLTSSVRTNPNDKRVFELQTSERNKPFILMGQNER